MTLARAGAIFLYCYLSIPCKRSQHLTKGCMSRQVGEGSSHSRIVAMAFKVEIKDIFPGTLARWARLQFEEVDLVCSQYTQAGIERAGLMGRCHDQHGLGLTFASWCRLPTEGNKARIIIFNGLD